MSVENRYLLAREWLIYVFDSLLIALEMAICTTWYVSDILSQATHSESVHDGWEAIVITRWSPRQWEDDNVAACQEIKITMTSRDGQYVGKHL